MSRPFGSAAELERRRLQAVSAVQEGESPEAVARIVGVNRSSMYRWLRCAQIEDGLAAKPHPGPGNELAGRRGDDRTGSVAIARKISKGVYCPAHTRKIEGALAESSGRE